MENMYYIIKATNPSECATFASKVNDKTAHALQIVAEFREKGFKGHVTLHYDGNGNIPKVEVVQVV